MKRALALLAALVAAVGLLPGVVAAQSQQGEVRIADVNLDRYDQDGRTSMVIEFRNLTEDIDPDLLEVFENGERKEILSIEPIAAARVPVGVVLVIDVSGSMEGEPIEAAKAAARSFVEQKRPEDFIAIVTFGDSVEVVSKFTNSATVLTEHIDSLTPTGATALYDGIVTGARLYSEASATLQKNMILLSDGADNGSQATLEEAIAEIEAQGVRVFGVALEGPDFSPEEVRRIAQEGGGIFYSTNDPAELSSLYGAIKRELDRALVVRFDARSSNPAEVEFAVRYGSLETSRTVSVPGFVTTTTAGPTTTLALAEVDPITVSSDLPLPRTTLRWLAAMMLGVTVLLFLVILFGTAGDGGGSRFGKRLASYGRRGGLVEEKRPLIERLPLLSRFTQAAEAQVKKRGLLGAVNATLEQGNLPLAAGEAIAASFGLAAVTGLIAGVVTFNVIVGGIVFALFVLLIFGFINYVGAREKKRFENQLPDTLTLISTSLRAGYSLLQAVEAVAQEAPNPTAREFGRAIAEARLGRPVTEALAGVTTRTQSKDFEWAVMAIEIQREVGGNLAEVLQTVADTMLARNRLRGEIRALTAEGRISAFVLGALPFAMAAFLWVSNQEYLMTLFTHIFGIIATIAGGLMMLAGIFWLRKIVNIEV